MALDEGKTIIRTSPDGNCLYAAAAMLFLGDPKLAHSLRRQTVTVLSANKSLLDMRDANDRALNEQEYMRPQATPGHCADEAAVVALMVLLDSPLRVVSEQHGVGIGCPL